MKALNPITSRLRNPRSRSLRAAVLVLAGAAVLSALAAQTHHRNPRVAAEPIDDTPVAPLPGRDYSMRLDALRGRVQFFDGSAQLAGITPASAKGCEANLGALEPGLWLAVPQTREDGSVDLVLQPMGTTAPTRHEDIVVSSCDNADASGAILSNAVRSHILERGGGVLFVDAGAAQNTGLDTSKTLARKVP